MEKETNKIKIKKLQICLALDETMLDYLNNVANKIYFPYNYDSMHIQDTIRAILTKDMKLHIDRKIQ